MKNAKDVDKMFVLDRVKQLLVLVVNALEIVGVVAKTYVIQIA